MIYLNTIKITTQTRTYSLKEGGTSYKIDTNYTAYQQNLTVQKYTNKHPSTEKQRFFSTITAIIFIIDTNSYHT